MGIRLDWEIEADKTTVRTAGEDPDAQRRRRAARLRLLVTVVILLAAMAGMGAYMLYRLYEANVRIETLLRDTVSAEVTALRLGDQTAFEAIQYSADLSWLPHQRETLRDYERLLLRNQNVQLTGRILDLVIDDRRARVHVEEIIDGVPYERVWFYWRWQTEYDSEGNVTFEGGWRHGPPDYTFWGDYRTYDKTSVSVDYFDVDAELAKLVGDRMDEWVNVACAAISCTGLPRIRVEIRPENVPSMAWSPSDPWLFQVLSPYTTRARADLPFEPGMQIEAASLLAERLVQHVSGGMQPVYPYDAYYFRQAIISWLVGRFVLIDTNSFMVASLAANYGEEAVGLLLQTMQPTSDVSIMAQITGASLDQANIDWRDFFTWRLVVENDLSFQRDAAFLTLYDTNDETVRTTAYARVGQVVSGQPVATLVRPTSPASDGSPQRVVTVHVTDGNTSYDQEVVFRLRNNIWLRAN